MSTGLIESPKAGQTFLLSVTAETVAPLAEKYMRLKVEGLHDKAGLAAVKKARLECVKARTTCEKEHKSIKEEALRECQRIDKSRRDILALIAPVEAHLTEQESIVEREEARLKKEAEDKQYAERLKILTDAGGGCAESVLRSMSSLEFDALVGRTKEEVRQRKEEEARRAAEVERLRAEQERLAAERAEFERQKAEADAEAARLRKIEDDRRAAEQAEIDRQRREIEAEQRRLADEAAVQQRKEEMARLEREAAERARLETEARLKREAEESERQRLEAEETARREEAKRPDREKLRSVADAIEAIKIPEVSEDSKAIAMIVANVVKKAAADIRKYADA